MDMDTYPQNLFYKNIYHNANPDHDEEDANSESTTFCCWLQKKKVLSIRPTVQLSYIRSI